MTLLGSKRVRTTAYHPQTNGMVERFHRQLKAALKAQPNPTSWMDALPLVLLGIRTALKADISATMAELVYGTTLRLPGEFFTSSSTPSLLDPPTYVSKLRTHMQHIQPSQPRPSRRSSHVSKALATTTHVFIRRDAVRKPLQPPYDGPYKVLKRTDKHFTVDINGQKDTVSVDRLKVAHLDIDTPHMTAPTPTTTATPSRTTRSGRRVHFPQRLSSYVG